MNDKIIGSGWSFPIQVGKSGGIALSSLSAEIEQSIKIILQTPIGQRIMRPTFGSRLHELVFQPNNAQTAAAAGRYVEEALGMWEPRIDVVQVDVQPNQHQDGSALLIQIQYQIRHTRDSRTLVYPFYLIPEEVSS
ncbi:MAG: GPW/gp25 family protein [Chloroflexota bacterium]